MVVYGGGFGLYLAVMLITMLIGGGAQAYVTTQLHKYSRVGNLWGVSGAEMARRMCIDKGIPQVGLLKGGPNVDHFDPRTNSVTLGTESYGERSITAIATAVHEVGHACQFAEGYTFMRLRSTLLPLTTLASNGWMIVFLMGLFMGGTHMGVLLMKIGVLLFAAVLLFHLVTLPVEFDASRRGLAYLQQMGMNQVELASASNVLRACALTYVAAALTAFIQFLYVMAIARND